MKAAIFVQPGEMAVQEVAKPTIQKPTDAILKIVRACVCGSDLWWFRGIGNREHGSLTGHEAIGIVEEVGADVTAVQPGDFIIAPSPTAVATVPLAWPVLEGTALTKKPVATRGTRPILGLIRLYLNLWRLALVSGSGRGRRGT